MGNAKFCQYGKDIKKRLVDIDKPQVWLIDQVHKDTGLYFDDSYLYKVMVGKNNNPKIKASIDKLLNMAGEEGEDARIS
ncbi:MAG: XRE family transcriptional regulator [Candidatus Fimivivens sp.]|nr:XRE family transcriptional regulator [Candidatus Fimivivens sp.]